MMETERTRKNILTLGVPAYFTINKDRLCANLHTLVFTCYQQWNQLISWFRLESQIAKMINKSGISSWQGHLVMSDDNFFLAIDSKHINANLHWPLSPLSYQELWSRRQRLSLCAVLHTPSPKGVNMKSLILTMNNFSQR